MKRFAVILIIAVLAIGCVFAVATGSEANVSDYKTNANDKSNLIYVTTTIGRIYPVYQIVAYTGTSVDETVVSGTTNNKIAGDTSVDGKVSVKIAVQHYGLKNNDSSSTEKVDIRYIGKVKVTVTASELKNTDTSIASAAANVVSTNGHVYMSDVAVATAFNVEGKDVTSAVGKKDKLLTLTAGTASGNNVATVTAKYENGQAIPMNAKAATIAEGATFTWDTTSLTAGDNYEATITITYTNES